MTRQGSPAAPSALVTVIVPAYNYAHFLPQTLDSVRAQTHPLWECIVVDDGSTDNTREVMQAQCQQDPRIQYIYQRNRGLSGARNTGLRAARGAYVEFLDADDLLEPRKLELQVRYLEQHPQVGILYGNVRYFRTEKPEELRYSMCEPDRTWMPEVSGVGAEVLNTLIRDNIMVVNGPLVRRAVIDRTGLFDEALRGLEDWHYWIRCADAGARFQYLDIEGTLALVRIHAASMSQDRLRMLQQKLLLRRKLDLVLSLADIHRQNRSLLSEDFGAMAVEQVRRGQRLSGVQHFWQAGLSSSHWRGRARWLKLALLASVVPAGRFEALSSLGVRQTLRSALRSALRRP